MDGRRFGGSTCSVEPSVKGSATCSVGPTEQASLDWSNVGRAIAQAEELGSSLNPEGRDLLCRLISLSSRRQGSSPEAQLLAVQLLDVCRRIRLNRKR